MSKARATFAVLCLLACGRYSPAEDSAGGGSFYSSTGNRGSSNIPSGSPPGAGTTVGDSAPNTDADGFGGNNGFGGDNGFGGNNGFGNTTGFGGTNGFGNGNAQGNSQTNTGSNVCVDGSVCTSGECCGNTCCAFGQMCCAGQCLTPSVNQPTCTF